MEDLIYNISISKGFETEEEKELGIDAIAFTKSPAIQIKGMAFTEATPKSLYFSDDKKYRIVAPAMVPMQIYRNDQGEEYYVEFTAEEIEKIHQKFMSNLNNQKENFNEEHNALAKVPAFILEAWLVENPLKDKA